MKTSSVLTLIASVFLVKCSVESARILGVFPMPGKSHYFLGKALLTALAKKGHDVTMISCFGEKNPPKNYRDILLPELMAEVKRLSGEMNMYELGEMNPFLNVAFVAYLMSLAGEMTLKEKSVQELINSDEKFDVVIVEQFFIDSHKALATHFGAHQIIFSSIGANLWVNGPAGNPSPPSYIPDSLLSYSSHMSFCERLTNSAINVFNTLVHHLYLYPKHNRVVKQYIPNPPDFYDVLYNASLVLLNSHPSLNQAVPHVPNMIEIGGFHIEPPQPLPQDLKQFLDEATDGVVYFSMGSNLRTADLPVEKRDAILHVFSKLKQKVLWKWEDDVLPGQPTNVKLSKWFPQQSILAHPNVKLFITHGGLLSITETTYFGVPILAIPIFGDQKLNAQLGVGGGFGLALPFRELNEQALERKLNELLANPKYYENAKLKSKIFHDRQVKPLDTAIYWVEYVLRHGGAPHLRVAALDLPWYKYHLLDVIAFVSFIGLISAFLLWFMGKKILRRLCARKSTKKQKKH